MNYNLSLSIAYIIAYLLAFILISMSNIKVSKFIRNMSLFILLLAVGGIAYNTLPKFGDDLYRYNLLLDNMRTYGQEYALKFSPYADTFLANLWFYAFSLFESNRFLPLVSSIIFYGICIYIFNRQKESLEIDGKIYLLFIFVFISSIFLRKSISCIRYFLAFSVLLVAVYRDFIKNKFDFATILMYLSTIFIHNSCLPVILLRVIFRKSQKLYKLKWAILISPLVVSIFNFTSNSIITTTLDKLFFYSSRSFVDIRLFAVKIIFLLLLFIASSIAKKNNKDELQIQNYCNFYQVLIILAFSFIYADEFLNRLFELIVLLSLPIINYVLRIKKKSQIIIVFSIIVLTFCLLIYQIVDISNNWYFY